MAFILDEILDKINLSECDGGGCAGGDGSGDAGTGSGISSGDVLGPGGAAENGGGCMGKDDFHVPFPVMPCLFRWPANWVGGSQKKRKKGKKTVTVKNPYVKGMKTIEIARMVEDRIKAKIKEHFEYQISEDKI